MEVFLAKAHLYRVLLEKKILTECEIEIMYQLSQDADIKEHLHKVIRAV